MLSLVDQSGSPGSQLQQTESAKKVEEEAKPLSNEPEVEAEIEAEVVAEDEEMMDVKSSGDESGIQSQIVSILWISIYMRSLYSVLLSAEGFSLSLVCTV